MRGGAAIGSLSVVCAERVRERQERGTADSSEDRDVRARLSERDLSPIPLLRWGRLGAVRLAEAAGDVVFSELVGGVRENGVCFTNLDKVPQMEVGGPLRNTSGLLH